jgi:hypothetical protein
MTPEAREKFEEKQARPPPARSRPTARRPVCGRPGGACLGRGAERAPGLGQRLKQRKNIKSVIKTK